MFEQSILIERPGNTGVSVLVSFTFQLLCFSILALIPLIFTERLAPMGWSKAWIMPPLPPPPLPLLDTKAAGDRCLSPAVPRPLFTAPDRIPAHLPTFRELAPIPAAGPGVPFGTGAIAAVGDLLGNLVRATPPAPPPALTTKPQELVSDKPVTVSGGVQEAKLIRRVLPVYPALARQTRIEGTVKLVGIISKQGVIENLQLVSGPALLVKAAFDAVKQWVYQPTLLSGQPVEVVAPIDVIFTLNR